jgi:hypothetical protein
MQAEISGSQKSDIRFRDRCGKLAASGSEVGERIPGLVGDLARLALVPKIDARHV